nr:BON domain-containing protein [Gammaproteobacteria bacterium]
MALSTVLSTLLNVTCIPHKLRSGLVGSSTSMAANCLCQPAPTIIFSRSHAEISLSVTSEDRQKERIIKNQIIALGDKTPLRAQVRVYNNQAVLIGEVLNQGTKERLEVVAVRQAKVKKVFNLLTIVNPLPEYKGFSDLLLK